MTSHWSRLFCLTLAVSLSVVSVAQAQAQKQTEPIIPTSKGVIAEIKKKGTQTSIMVAPESGGEAFEVPLTPVMPFAIEAKGDIGFVREKQFAAGTGFVSNNTLFVQKWTVHVGNNAKRMQPTVRNLPDTDENGEKKQQTGVKYVEVSGQIMSLKPAMDDPNKQQAVLKVGGLKGTPAFFEKNAQVIVSTNDTALLKDGAEVEYIVAGGNPKKPKIGALKVVLMDALKSEEFFKEEETRDPKKK